MTPPSVGALVGFTRSYCTDFSGTRLPPGWDRFSGIPLGDPAGRFARSHVSVGNGVLTLRASRDRAYANHWATGGVCQCGRPRTYGAFFVRSRVTGAGPDEINLLWPVRHVWPPEIDFNESVASSSSSTWSVHYTTVNHVAHGGLHLDLTKWHTWGVLWMPHVIRFTVDGRLWGEVTAARAIPHLPMTLDISQQTFCGINPQCPTRPVSMHVAWVAIYAPRA